MVRYLFYTIGDLTYQSPLVHEANKFSSFLMTFVLPPEKFRHHLKSPNGCEIISTREYPLFRSTLHHDKKKPPYEQKGMDCLTLEDGTDKLFRNFRNRLPINVT